MNSICHVLSGHKRFDTRIFSKQCKSLVEFGYEVCILTNDNLPNEVVDKISIVSCLSNNTNRIQEILNAKKTFLKPALRLYADIYQLHGPELIPLGIALKRRNKIVFYDAHEDLPRQILEKEWIPKLFRKPLSLIIELYFRFTLYKFDEIITVSPHIIERLKLISNSVNLITNYPIIDNTTFFDLNSYKQRENILCYSGTVYNDSNQEYILQAISNIKHVKYNIVGHLEKNYQNKLSKYKSWEKVNFLGKISKYELTEFYNKAIVGMSIFNYSANLGYKKGTLGINKLFEYMAAGLPIICTDFDLWKEIIDKYECGLYVKPNCSEQIVTAINFLLNNKEKAYEMGQNGMKAVIREYNWGTQEKIYVNLFCKYDKK